MAAPAAPRKRATLSASTPSAASTAASAATAAGVSARRTINTTRTRQTPANTAATAPNATDDLAKKLDGLALTAEPRLSVPKASTSARKRDVDTSKSPEMDGHAIQSLMKEITASLSVLSTAKKLGKQKPDPKACYKQVASALDKLRAYKGTILDVSKRLEIEKAALILVGHLNDAAEFSLSLQQLQASKQAVLRMFPELEAKDESYQLAAKLSAVSLATSSTSSRRPTNSTSRALSASLSSSRSGHPNWTSQHHLLQYPMVSAGRSLPPAALGHAVTAVSHAAIAILPDSSGQKTAEMIAFLDALEGQDGVLGLLSTYREMKPASALLHSAESGLIHLYTAVHKATSTEMSEPTPQQLRATFRLRCFGVRCLLECLPFLKNGEAAQKPEEKVVHILHKACTLLCKGLVSEGVDEAHLATELTDNGLNALLNQVVQVFGDKLQEQESFKTYLAWLQRLADRGQDNGLRARLQALSGEPLVEALAAANLPEQLLQTCGAIDRATADMRAWIKTGCMQPSDFDTAQLCSSLRTCAELAVQDLDSCSSNVWEALATCTDRVRFYVCRAVRSKTLSSTHELALCEILPHIVAIVQGASSSVQMQKQADFLEAGIDSAILVAQRVLKADDPASYNPALQQLQTAAQLVERSQECPTYSQLCRCLAAAATTAGNSLFNEKRYANVIPFLGLACNTSKLALTPERALDNESKDLSAQLSKRLETLGQAHHHINEKAEAATVYRQAVLARFEHALVEVTPEQQSLAAETLLQAPDMVKLIARYSRLTVMDLLMTPEVSSLTGSSPGWTPSMEGLLAEAQAASLDEHWSHPEVTSAVYFWLGQAEKSFRSEQHHPASASRLCRILLRQTELSATVSGNLNPENLADKATEIVKLCENSQSPAPQAFAKIWIAFDAIRRNDPKASKILGKELKEALKLLIDDVNATARDVMAGSPPRPVMRPVVTVASSATKTAPSTRTTKRTLVSAVVAGKRIESKPSLEKTARKPLSPKNASQAAASRNVTPQRKSMPVSPGALQRKASGTATGQTRSRALDPWRTAPRAYATLNAAASVLGAFGHTFLRISCLKLLRALDDGQCSSNYIETSVALAHEYQQLGKWKRAEEVLATCKDAVKARKCTPEASLMYLLRHADYASCRCDHKEGLAAYNAAVQLAQSIEEDSEGSTAARIVARSQLLLRTATAAGVFSRLQWHQNLAPQALATALQALRLAHRCITNLARLSSPSPRISTVQTSGAGAGDALPSLPPAIQTQRGTAAVLSSVDAALGWNVSQCMCDTLLWIAKLYFVQGSPKIVAYYLKQAHEFATQLSAPRMLAKVVVKQAELALALRNQDQIDIKMQEIAQLAAEDGGLATIDVKRLKACQAALQVEGTEAAEAGFASARNALQKLDRAFADTDAQIESPKRSSSKTAGDRSNALLPDMQTELVTANVSALHRWDRSHEVLAELQTLAYLEPKGHATVYLDAMKATANMIDGLANLRKDPVLGLLHESILSAPPLVRLQSRPSSQASEDLKSFLPEAELLLLSIIAEGNAQHSSEEWSRICLSLASLSMLQAVLGESSSTAATAVLASSLASQTSITLRREMLDSIQSRLVQGIMPNDLKWPVHPYQQAVANGLSRAEFWKAARTRYINNLNPGSMHDISVVEQLPAEWSVLTLHLTLDKQSLMAVKLQRGKKPFVLQLPLDRLGRREGEDHVLSFDLAKEELKNIIKASNEGCGAAKHAKSNEQKRVWWQQRKELEQRMGTLIVNIEQRWLGAFKNALVDHSTAVEEVSREQLEQCLRRSILTTRDNRAAQLNFDSQALEAFFALEKTCTNEDLEDFFYFVIDSFQFAGVQIALDEIDVDQAVVDLRTILEERVQAKPPVPPSSHLFLILDRELHSFPWESLPSFGDRSVSRLPSLSFLRDRLEAHKENPVFSDAISINREKVFYVLNPGDDLAPTQREFSDWLQQSTWSGITGRKPMEEEMKRGLAGADLFLYFGHGGANQYVRSSTLRALPKCATAMLWGCSSGHLAEQGDFEETGNPWTYMVAGSPAVIANLWDVTDKDIDRFAKATFTDFGIMGDVASPTSLPAAVAASRNACTLRYLNGAAPVVWGFPVRLQPVGVSATAA